MESKRKLRVAIIGQGRSGRDIHGAFFRSEENLVATVVAIVDRDEERRLRAKEEFGCDVYADYTELFGRVSLDLGDAADAEVTTDELLNRYKKGQYSTYLEALYFQYGRYLLIASSRSGAPSLPIPISAREAVMEPSFA